MNESTTRDTPPNSNNASDDHQPLASDGELRAWRQSNERGIDSVTDSNGNGNCVGDLRRQTAVPRSSSSSTTTQSAAATSTPENNSQIIAREDGDEASKSDDGGGGDCVDLLSSNLGSAVVANFSHTTTGTSSMGLEIVDERNATNEAPMHPTQIAAYYDAMDDVARSIRNPPPGDDAEPIRDAQFLTLYQEMEDQKNSKEKQLDMNEENDEIHFGYSSEDVDVQQQPSSRGPTGTATNPSGTMATAANTLVSNNGRAHTNPGLELLQQRPVANPTTVAPIQSRQSSATDIENGQPQAALASSAPLHEVQATLVADEVYIAEQIPNHNIDEEDDNDQTHPRRRLQQRYIIPILLVIIGVMGGILGTVLLFLSRSNNSKVNENNIESGIEIGMEGGTKTTTASPSSSSSPSSSPLSSPKGSIVIWTGTDKNSFTSPSMDLSDAPSALPSTGAPTPLPTSSAPSSSPTGSNCLMVTTGTSSGGFRGGPVNVFVDSGNGYILLSVEGYVYREGETVLDQCFDTIVGVQVSNDSTNGWVGSFELSRDGKASYHQLMCSDCSGNSNAMPIAVDGNGDSLSGCLDGKNCTLTPPSTVWKQVGDTIKGDATGDGLGSSVAISGNGMIIAIGESKGEYRELSRVKIYGWNNTSSKYDPLGKPILGQSADNFGSVALSADGKTLVIGSASSSGRLNVYSLEDSTLSLIQTIESEVEGDRFGYSVSLSAKGNIMAVGAPANKNGPGCVKVFVRDNNSFNYTQLGESLIGEADGDNFGHSVAISGDGNTVAIGAPRIDSNDPIIGHAKVYRIDDDESSWTELGQDLMGDNSSSTSDHFGWSVTLSERGNILAISAPLSGSSFYVEERGLVAVYGLDSGNLSWKKRGNDIAGIKKDHLGRSLSLSADGTSLAIGAMDNDDKGLNSGRAMVYGWERSDSSYKQLGSYIRGEAAGDQFGVSIAISSTGSRLVVGGWLNDENGKDSGQVKVYEKENSPGSY